MSKKMFVAAAFCGALALSGTAHAITATEPAPRYNFKHAAWWFGRFDELKRQAAEEGDAVKVVFLGDSITENWMAPGKEVWKLNFEGPKYKAINCGFGGDRTDNLLWRIRNGQLDGLDPKVVSLLIGTNNTFFRSLRDEPPADTARAVATIIQEIQARCPNAKIILTGILPSGDKPDGEKRLRDIRINEQLQMLADGEKVLWLNFGPKLLEADGTLTKEMAPDFTHPAEKGYEIWTERLVPYLDWCLGYSAERPQGVAGKADGRAAFWQSRLFAQKRDEIMANEEHYYDFAFLGDRVAVGTDKVASPAPVRGAKILEFPFDFSPSVSDTIWAVENAGLCDGYSARYVVLSRDLWTADLARVGVEATLAEAKRLVEAVRQRQPQAKIVLAPAGAEMKADLQALADGDGVFLGGPGVLRPSKAFEPSPRTDLGWLERFAMNRGQIAASGGWIDMVFIGDSITHYWDVGEGPDCSTEIEDLRKTYSILNCAYGGDWTQNRLWCVRNGLLDGYRTKLVMLHIGTNNSGGGTDPAETFAGIKAIVATIRAKQPQAKILLLNIFPRGTADCEPNALNRKVNALINAEPWDDAVIVKDIGSNFADEKGDTLPGLFDDERLHFIGTEGYARWRKAVEPIFKEVVGK